MPTPTDIQTDCRTAREIVFSAIREQCRSQCQCASSSEFQASARPPLGQAPGVPRGKLTHPRDQRPRVPHLPLLFPPPPLEGTSAIAQLRRVASRSRLLHKGLAHKGLCKKGALTPLAATRDPHAPAKLSLPKARMRPMDISRTTTPEVDTPGSATESVCTHGARTPGASMELAACRASSAA